MTSILILRVPDSPHSQSQNDYLRQWVPKTDQYLNILLHREVPANRICIICGTDGVYKCHNCFGEPLFCTNCCRSQHQRVSLHRISQWTGTCFEDSCLVKTGLVIWLGHDGDACPWDDEVADELFADSRANSDISDGTSSTARSQQNGDEQAPGLRSMKDADDLLTGVPFIKNSKRMTMIVDMSGVHTHMVKYCTCTDAPAADIQLFQMGLFPASFTQPKTAFTFDVLNNFLLDNLECGTSAMNYYSKLRRMTTSVFPHWVPVSSSLLGGAVVHISPGPVLGAYEGGQTMAQAQAPKMEWLRP